MSRPQRLTHVRRARLPFRFDAVEHGRHIRYDATSACGGCVLKPPCTRSQGGRRITRWVDEHLSEAMEQRGRSRPEVMKPRKQLVELRSWRNVAQLSRSQTLSGGNANSVKSVACQDAKGNAHR